MADIVGDEFRKLTPAQKAAERTRVANQTPKLPSAPALEVAPSSPQAGQTGTKPQRNIISDPRKRAAGVQVNTVETPTLVAPTSTFDPAMRGGGGLGAMAGAPTDPFSARTLDESADMINKKIDDEVIEDGKVPTIDTGSKTETTTPKPLTRTERIAAVQKELEMQTSQITSEPARLNKTEEIAALQKQAAADIKNIEAEQKLEDDERAKLKDDFSFEQFQEKAAGARAIMEKEGLTLTAAARAFDKRETAKANLDPEQIRIFDSIVDQITEDTFDPNDAYRVAIAEYEKDGVDEDDMENAKKAIASVYGQNFADEMEDDFLINDRKIDSAIVEGNRKLINAKKVGSTIAAGQAGAMVTNSYLKTIFDTAPELVPGAISQILTSNATDDAKRQASAFAKDFYSDVETGIGQDNTGNFQITSFGNRLLRINKDTGEMQVLTSKQASTGTGISSTLLENIQNNPRLFSSLSLAEKTKLLKANFVPPKGATLSENQRAGLEISLGSKFDSATKEARQASRNIGIIDDGYNEAVKALEAGESLNAPSQAVLVTFQKMLDPTSVVRESEYARSGDGQSLISAIEGKYQKLKQGGAGVTIEDLKTFRDMSNTLLKNYEKDRMLYAKRTANVANEYGVALENVLTEDVLTKLDNTEGADEPPQEIDNNNVIDIEESIIPKSNDDVRKLLEDNGFTNPTDEQIEQAKIDNNLQF